MDNKVKDSGLIKQTHMLVSKLEKPLAVTLMTIVKTPVSECR